MDWGSTAYTFYSANYVDYWYDDSLAQDRKRIDIAKDVIGDLVAANTSVDFGMAVFNSKDAVEPTVVVLSVKRLIEGMQTSDRNELISIIDNDLSPETNTPLCETFYEVYRYFNGDSVLYGLQKHPNDDPDRDTDAENDDGDYISPLGDCAYIRHPDD
ncbi:MAG: hypothetical protein U5K56_01600 [Halioglobus sp.]|nr:hypothetical protein [Halioglobus sp.]